METTIANLQTHEQDYCRHIAASNVMEPIINKHNNLESKKE
jgi:hypothetical protein